MEQNNSNNAQTVECSKCHKTVNSTDGVQSTNGFVCNECVKTKKHKRYIIGGSCAALLAALGITTGVYMSSPSERTADGFAGVGEITDSMNIEVDSANISFDMSTATISSAPISTQAPISNLAEFKRAVEQNVADASNSKSKNLVLPTVGAMFEINTNYFVSGAEDVVKELAQTYLKTNKQSIILVEGFTCDLGGSQINMRLSKLRADAVRKVLENAGVPSDKIETKWFGKSRNAEFKYANQSDYRRVIISIK